MAKNRYEAYFRFLYNLPGFLKNPINVSHARQEIEKRMVLREENFLRLVKHAIYRNNKSPYIPLLKEAGCTYGDLESEVKKKGLEAVLKQLHASGVWVSLEESKGRKPIRRGNAEWTVNPDAFDNPYQVGGYGVSSGGTSGRSAGTKLDLNFLAARTAYDSVMFDMLGIEGTPIILWYPILPASTGIGNSLRYAKMGHSPVHWFNMVIESRSHISLESRLATKAIVLSSWLIGCPLPRPEDAALDDVDRIADQIAEYLIKKGGCVFQSYVSQAVRISKAVRERVLDMQGLVIIVGSEPLTKARKQEIESTGARLYNRYFATELGTIGMGCGNPADIDDVHLMSDMLAIIQSPQIETGQAGPLFFTSLNAVMPKIMINVQLGDMAIAGTRSCGCEFDKLGFSTHLSMVRSYTRVTSQGMALPHAMLERIVEDLLTLKYGGTSLDYQWIEMEDECGRVSLKLRISPDVGPIDENQVVRDILDEIRKGGQGERLMSDIWRQSGLISVSRETPGVTVRGKIIPVLSELN